MPWHSWTGLVFLLILGFLVLNNASGTVNVLGALGQQATGLTGALQGRKVTNGSVSLT